MLDRTRGLSRMCFPFPAPDRPTAPCSADDRRLPFGLKVPNAITSEALTELEDGKGLRFASLDHVMANLHADECRLMVG